MLTSCPTPAQSFPAPAVMPHEDLLRGPAPLFTPDSFTETWRKGPAVGRRVYALRRSLGSENVSERTFDPSLRSFGKGGSGKTVEVRYSVPRGVTVPAIEARKAVAA